MTNEFNRNSASYFLLFKSEYDLYKYNIASEMQWSRSVKQQKMEVFKQSTSTTADKCG